MLLSIVTLIFCALLYLFLVSGYHIVDSWDLSWMNNAVIIWIIKFICKVIIGTMVVIGAIFLGFMLSLVGVTSVKK